jgi:hypothetical protein
MGTSRLLLMVPIVSAIVLVKGIDSDETVRVAKAGGMRTKVIIVKSLGLGKT